MIQLKRCNYFTGDLPCVSSAVTSIVKFLELEGSNPVLFTPPKPIGRKGKNITSLIYSMNPQIIWDGFDDFRRKIEDPASTFRASLLVFDFWDMNRALIPKYKELIDKLGIDYIIVAKEYIYKDSDDVADFHVKAEYKELASSLLGHRSEIWITNKIDGWSATLDSLKTGYIRDKKIDDIFRRMDD